MKLPFSTSPQLGTAYQAANTRVHRLVQNSVGVSMQRFVVLLTGLQAARLQPSVHGAADRLVRHAQAYSILTTIVRHTSHMCIRIFASSYAHVAPARGVLTSVQAYQYTVHVLQVSDIDLISCEVIKVITC